MGCPVNLEIDPNADSAIYIFDVVFECKVRHVDLISEEDLRDFGSFDTGMEYMNNDNMTQLVSANLSIAQMAEHIHKGFALRFVHDKDPLKMYEFTQHHLQRWLGKMGGTSLNGGGIPIDDLIKLDHFCSVVYEQAKFYDEAKLTSLEQRFGTSGGFDAIRNMFGNNQKSKEDHIQALTGKHRKGFTELLTDMKVRKELTMNDGITIRDLNG